MDGNTRKQKQSRLRRLSQTLRLEPLEQRLALSADGFLPGFSGIKSPISNDEFVLNSSDTTVHIVDDRTSFRNLDVSGYPGATVPDEAAIDFLNDYAGELGIPADAIDNLQLLDASFGLASSHAHFQQVHDELPVDGARIVVSFGNEGQVQTVHTSLVDHDPDTSSITKVTSDTARDVIKLHAGILSTWDAIEPELVWAVNEDNDLELAWQMMIHAIEPEQHHWLGTVSAVSGKLLSIEDRSAHAIGTGDTFFPNPYQTQGNGDGLVDNNDQTSPALDAQVITVTLERLNEDTGRLIGDWVDVTLTGGGLDYVIADEPDRIYQYDRSDDRFEQVVAYHVIDQAQEYIHSLGYDDDTGPTANGIRDFPILVNTHWTKTRNAFYSPADDTLHFGDATNHVDLAEDGDIVLHEYGHAIQHGQNPSWGGGEMGAMGEGFSDYWAASFFADTGDPVYLATHAPAVGEWGFLSDLPGVRRVDGNKIYPDDLTSSVHESGEIWSAALWELRTLLGRDIVDVLVLESHFELPSSSTMTDGAFAILAADQNLNGAANADVIQQVFEDRGIFKAPDDHGNASATSTSVTVPFQTTARVDFVNDADYFVFDAVAGTTYEIETAVLTAFGDSTLNLYRADGRTQIAFDDDGGSDENGALVRWTAEETGQLFVEASGPNAFAQYEITIETVPTPNDDNGNDIATATAISTPGLKFAEIETVNDIDTFSFTLEAGSAYTVQVIGASLARNFISVTDVDGNTIAEAEDEVTVIPQETQTFYAAVVGESQGTYTFYVDIIPDDHGETFEDATRIASLTSEGNLEYASDRDVFEINVLAGARYALEVLPGSLQDSLLTVFNADGTQIAFDDDGGIGLLSRVGWQAAENGSAFIEVAGFDDAAFGTYLLELTIDDHADFAAQATPFATATTARSFNIHEAADVDVFEFNLAAGTALDIRIEGDPLVHTGSQTELTIYAGDGETRIAFDTSTGSADYAQLIWAAPESGTYFVEVRAAASDTPYALATTLIDPPVDDHGDDAATATAVENGGTVSASLEVASDLDTFSFPVVAGAPYTVELISENISLTQLTITDASGNAIAAGSGVVEFAPGTTGTAFVTVQGFSQGVYLISIERNADDHGETLTDATPIRDIGSTSGVLEFEADIDLFEFTAVPGGEYQFGIAFDALSQADVALLDSSGTVIDTVTTTASANATLNWQATSSDTHFIRIQAADGIDSGGYELLFTFDDHGDSIAAASLITDGTTTSSRIETLGDIDFFRFDAVAGTTYQIDVAPEDGDPLLRLFDSDATTVITTNDDGGTGSGALVRWTAPSNGTYYFEVSGTVASVGYGLTFESISVLPDDHGNAIGSATFVSNTSVTAGAVEIVDDQDVFAFTVTGGQLYQAEFSLSTLANAELQIITATGQVLASATNADEAITWTAPATGTNYAVIQSASQGDYEFSVALVVDDFSGGTSIPVPSNIDGWIEIVGDRDLFAVPAVTTETYNIDLELGTLNDGVFRIRNLFGQELLFVDDGVGLGATLVWQPPTNGVFLFEVAAKNDSSAGTYQFNISADEHGNTPATATSISTPGTASTRVEADTDIDVFQTSLVGGTTYAFQVDTSGGDSTLTLIGTDGTTELAFDNNGGTADGSRIVWTAPTSGTYYLAVGGTGSATPFQLNTSITTPPADDHGDSTSTATIIANPSIRAGEIGLVGDVDVFAFFGSSGRVYRGQVLLDSLSDSQLTILAADGSTLATDEDGGAGDTSWAATYSGTYYAVISSTSQGTYEFSVDEVTTDDHGDTTSEATDIAVPSTTTALISQLDDVDVLKFAATGGLTYSISVDAGTTGDSTLRLIDTDAVTEIAFDDNGGPANSSAFLWTAPISGDYFIEVAGTTSAIPYELDIETVAAPTDDHGNALVDSTTVAVPSETSGNLEVINDVDSFAFEVVANRSYRIQLPATDKRVTVYAADGSFIASDATVAGLAEIVWTATSSGTQRAVVSGTSQGGYSLSVSEVVDDPGANSTISVPSVNLSSLSADGDRDSFVFLGVAGVEYRIEVNALSLTTPILRLLSLQGDLLLTQEGDASGIRLEWQPPSSGPYFIQIGSIDDMGTGTYELRLAVDDFEDTADLATSIAVPGSIDFQIERPDDVDAFSFNANAGQTIEINTTSASGGDAAITLLDTDGTTVLSTNDNGGSGQDARIVWTFSETGTYFLAAEGSVESTAYQISLATFAPPTDDHGDTITNATLVAEPSTTNGNLETSTDTDGFGFELIAGAPYSFRVQHDSLESSSLVLTDVFGSVVATADFSDSGAELAYSPTLSDRHYAFVTGGSQGSYSLTVERLADDHGDTASAATTMTVPGDVDGNLEFDADRDLFAFEAAVGNTYRIEFTENTLTNGVFQLLDVDGQTELAFDGVVGSNQVWTPTSAGTYFLSVSSANGETGSYEIQSFIDDHENTIGDASSIAVPSSTNIRTEYNSDIDYLTFAATTGTTYRVSLDDAQIGNRRLTLIDTNGTSTLGFAADTSTQSASFLFTAPATGNYSILFEGPETTLAHSLAIESIATPQDDHGDDLASATVLTVPGESTGDIQSIGDTDVFSISGIAGVPLVIDFSTGSLEGVTATLSDANGSVLETIEDQLSFTPTVSGLLYVSVNAPTQGTYDLAVRRSDDFGGTLAEASPIAVPSITDGELNFDGDVDAFSFSAVEGVTYLFELQLNATSGTLRLVNENGVQLAVGDAVDNGTRLQIGWEAPASDTYFLLYEGDANQIGPYQILSTLSCDLVNQGDGCDIADIDALYAEAPGATPLTAILKWLEDASATQNPLKPSSESVFVPGDVNLDGSVTSTDLGLVLNRFGDTTSANWGSGNINGDQFVNSSDLGLVLNNFNFRSIVGIVSDAPEGDETEQE